jgi:hypothetical protein
VKDLSGKVHKEPEFERKILTDIGELESVERRWLAGILAGIIVGAVDLAIFLGHLWEVLNGQPASLPRISFIAVVATNVVLLVMSVMAFAEYFSLSLSFHFNVRRGMIIGKRRSRQRPEDESDA